MRASLSLALAATIPVALGKIIHPNAVEGANVHAVAAQAAKDIPSVQTVPSAAEAAEAVEAVQITKCCLNIAKLLPGKVYGSSLNSTGYNTQSKSYYSKQEIDVKPACFVLPSNANDVSTIITALASPIPDDVGNGAGTGEEDISSRPGRSSGWGGWLFGGWGSKSRGGTTGAGPRGSRATKGPTGGNSKVQPKQADGETCKFAIRSGGHQPIKEFSNIQGGVTIDLSYMKQVEVAPDRSYVKIGPGNRWADVYSKLDALKLGTSGGRVATVGVGGLTTGGGISFFSREHGLVCDNVIEFEVVLADGSIVLANALQNSDLFRALKGGSGNFGIVTRINMKAFPSGTMWGGTIIHALTDNYPVRQKLFRYFEKFTQSTTDVNAAWIHSWTYTTGLWVGTSNVEYTLPSQDTPEVFEPITTPALEISALTTIGPNSLTNLTKSLASLNPDGSRQLFATLTHKNSAEFMEAFIQLSKDVVSTVSTVIGLKWSNSFQSLSHSIYSKALNTGGNSLGLADETDDLVVVLLTATWDLSINDKQVYEAAKFLFTQAESLAAKMKVDNGFLYLNYADKWQDPIAGYGLQSVETLRQVAQRYDPKGLFQKQVPGGFKIPKKGSARSEDDQKWVDVEAEIASEEQKRADTEAEVEEEEREEWQ